MTLNPQAEELNEIIKKNNPVVLELLSEKGKAIYFPKKGILAQAADAKGKKINATIGIGLDEDGTPLRLNSIADNVKLNPKDIFPYAPSFGKPELRKVWREMIYKKNPSLKAEISTPVTTNALTHGLSMCAYLFADQGDKIILPDLFWGNYKLILIRGYGVELDAFPTFKDKGFNLEGLKEKLSQGTGKKILLLNFPNNPSGYTPTEEEAKEIANIIKESAEAGNKIVVLIDDAYFGLVYKEGVFKESIFIYLADMHENILAVKVDGATKEDYVWGFRTGFLTFASKGGNEELYKALESKTAGAVRGNISNAPHISQSLVLNAFTSETYKQEKQEKYNLLKERFNIVAKVLEENKDYENYFKALPFNSGYFMCIRLNEGIDGEQVRQLLLEKYDTGVIAMKDILRIAFSSTKKELIPELFQNIYNACKEIKG
ncbi:aminotransferase class I/II-fold pyridoxal phosphate-dependent enzyme [Candidatus Woesearchaeota archaeon]|nr:aminotransferase class I/II-fold pyridoxal phosphate-dependent enzyme [Candidatus Woesearchaeota archaeon]